MQGKDKATDIIIYINKIILLYFKIPLVSKIWFGIYPYFVILCEEHRKK